LRSPEISSADNGIVTGRHVSKKLRIKLEAKIKKKKMKETRARLDVIYLVVSRM